MLIDRNLTHLWKPLLHEVAAGSLDSDMDGISYRAHAAHHGFDFQLGTLMGIDREEKNIVLAPILDEQGSELVASRRLSYDCLVVSIGSVTNDFNTKGAADHCVFLDATVQAERFHKKLMNAFIQLKAKKGRGVLDVAIVGAGATGVELSAELHNAADLIQNYGFDRISRDKLNVTLIEAGPRILSALPERISSSAHKELASLGVTVRTSTLVKEVTEEGLVTDTDELIPARIKVWAAGVKAPEFMRDIGGLETNRINQLVVRDTLQTTRDSAIFAMGDCASCQQPDGSFVPPRAQSAHQMASLVYKNIVALVRDKSLTPFVYKDHGSLVSLSRYSTVGSLMGNLTGGSMTVEGRIARVVYISLYRLHQIALHGYIKTGLLMLVGRLNRALRPTLKLH